jgi:hypothetical protein
MFYTYLWLRENGTPYYVGKGKGKRGFTSLKHSVNCPPKERIIIYPAESEVDAFETEIALIWYYGRKDLGVGCLRNHTDGGEGVSGPKSLAHRLNIGKAHVGMKRSEQAKKNISEACIGHKHTEEWKQKHSELLSGRKRPPRTEEWRRKQSVAMAKRMEEKYGPNRRVRTKTDFSL